MTGFVAGTLVHTDKGLVPIQEIKVGDMVVSRPENNERETVYKPVIKTFKAENVSVCLVAYMEVERYKSLKRIDGNDYTYIVTTEHHPFWVVGRGWVLASNLMIGELFLLANYSFAEVMDGDIDKGMAALPVYRTAQEDIGWVNGNPDYSENGSVIYLDHGRVDARLAVNDLVYNDEVLWNYDHENSRIKRTVYNLEVEDHHTYFVGHDGLWVHCLNESNFFN
jgi:hypothetical protein